MEVARLLQKKIYVGAAKLQILKHLELPQEIMHWFTANEAESHIHVVPMWTLASFKRMKYLSNQYAVSLCLCLHKTVRETCLHKTVRETLFLFKGLPDSGHDKNS